MTHRTECRRCCHRGLDRPPPLRQVVRRAFSLVGFSEEEIDAIYRPQTPLSETAKYFESLDRGLFLLPLAGPFGVLRTGRSTTKTGI